DVAVPGEISGERWHMHRVCMQVRGHVHGGSHLCLHVQKIIEEQNKSPRADHRRRKTSDLQWAPHSGSKPAQFQLGSVAVTGMKSGKISVNRLRKGTDGHTKSMTQFNASVVFNFDSCGVRTARLCADRFGCVQVIESTSSEKDFRELLLSVALHKFLRQQIVQVSKNKTDHSSGNSGRSDINVKLKSHSKG
ncbi:unnamed protein product, partial [Dovyalis caffra]